MKRRNILCGAIVLVLALSACSNEKDRITSLDRTTSGGTGEVLMVSADPSNKLAFAPALLTAKPNQPIKIQFANPVVLPVWCEKSTPVWGLA